MEFQKNKVVKILVAGVFVLAIFGIGFVVGKDQTVCRVCKPETVDFSLFWDAYTKVRQNFINSGKVSDQQIIYGAIQGMTKSLGDPYTTFFNPQDAKMFQQD